MTIIVVTVTEAGNRRSMLGRATSAVYPDYDYARWRSRRRREVAASLSTPEYADAVAIPSFARSASTQAHVVVVPQEGESYESFKAGTRNFYYEAAQNLRELGDPTRVSVFSIDRDESPAAWHARLLNYLRDSQATHLLTHIEHDPGHPGKRYTWDTFWTLAAPRWNGVLLGVMFDSAYPWITAGSKQLARISDRYVVVDICMPMDGAMVRGRPEIGPVNMPVSRQSLDLVAERLRGVEPEWDVSFIGALYPYRVKLIERLRSLGVQVAVNPHRPDITVDKESSRRSQPEWLEYMAGLRSSRMTINFARSSAGPIEQLKTRVLEATLARTLLLTDDQDRTRLFWKPEEEYVYFRDSEALPGVITDLLADPDRVRRIAVAGEQRAWELAPTHFWTGIDAGLARRGLPQVLDTSA